MTTTTKRSQALNRANPAGKDIPPSNPESADNNHGVSPSNLAMLRQIYIAMLKCRMMGERVRDGGMVTYDLTTGHEAVVIGASIELQPDDTVASSHRNFAAHIVVGTPLKHLLKEIAANSSDESGASILSRRWALPGTAAILLADPFNLGTGLALSHKLERKTKVVVAFWDEHAASLEASQEALKFAGIHKLPIIYVTRSKQSGDLGRRKHSALEEFSFMAKDYGFPSILVDGKDVVAVWRAAQESIHRARNGSGPTLIECQTESASFTDPLAHMQHYMSRRGAWDDGWKRQVVGQITTEIEDAMR
jgi:TPP-dependent pyruvate/acetoin dehydrogenase alpha subunit